jgi:trehalose 6-phosphate phosphatase
MQPAYCKTPGTEWDAIAKHLEGKRVMVFLDYDGTLTPIVEDPDKAIMCDHMRGIVASCASRFTTSIVTGRSREKITNFVKLDSLCYAASHGFDIVEPHGTNSEATQAAENFLPCLAQTRTILEQALVGIDGAFVEDNKYALSVHYRQCKDHAEVVPHLRSLVENTLLASPEQLRMSTGKCVFELRPAMEWDKGKAVEYLMSKHGFDDSCVCLYIGDDVSDEAAFKTIGENGISILVSDVPKETYAKYYVKNPDEVGSFLQCVVDLSCAGLVQTCSSL